MTIYHGSHEIVEMPILEKGKIFNDYGQGFYCTEQIELAKEWACGENRSGFVNCYDIDMDGLKLLNLSEAPYSIFHWLALLMENRTISLTAPIMKNAVAWLHQNFLIDTSSYDVIIGYRADDSYFSFAKAFVKNSINVEQLSRAMRLGNLGEQIVLKSEKAFSRIQYQKAEFVDDAIYYPKRKARDERARDDYYKMLGENSLSGVYIIDLMRKEVSVDELCL